MRRQKKKKEKNDRCYWNPIFRSAVGLEDLCLKKLRKLLEERTASIPEKAI